MTYELNGANSVIRQADGACIPFADGNQDYAEYRAWIAAGNTPAPPDAPTTAQLVAANTAAIQAELDGRAQAKGYDNIISACSYAGQAAGAPFQAEGAAFLAWRSAVWAHAYQVLANVQGGISPMPTPAEAVAAMPALVLP